MDTTLVTVTLLSMGMAGALSVIVWRLLRDERQRSDARVAALTALAGSPERHGPERPGPERAQRVEGAQRADAPRPAPQIAVHPQVHRDRAASDLDLAIRPAPPASRVVEGSEMFVER